MWALAFPIGGFTFPFTPALDSVVFKLHILYTVRIFVIPGGCVCLSMVAIQHADEWKRPYECNLAPRRILQCEWAAF